MTPAIAIFLVLNVVFPLGAVAVNALTSAPAPVVIQVETPAPQVAAPAVPAPDSKEISK